MDGTVVLKDDVDYVVNQMWDVVSKSISYSLDLIDGLFSIFGVTEDEKSPFCHSFSYLDNLKDKLIAYLLRTFQYNGIQVNGSEKTNNDKYETGDADTPNQDLLVNRINRFAHDMKEVDDEDNVDGDDTTVVPPIATANSKELMNHFHAIVSVASADDILEKVLIASPCLEGKDNMQGAASLVRKAKSLV